MLFAAAKQLNPLDIRSVAMSDAASTGAIRQFSHMSRRIAARPPKLVILPRRRSKGKENTT
jgi:hypothetical protein